MLVHALTVKHRFAALVLLATLVVSATVARGAVSPAAFATLHMVVVVGRHGVRSPTNPGELSAYSALPWPAWSVPPGNLTPHGAAASRLLGAAYRAMYAERGLFPRTGCPPADTSYVWADVDERTKATATAFIDGLAPHCAISAHDAGTAVDPLFHAIPTLGKASPILSRASFDGGFGATTQAIVPAFGATFRTLDNILGCAASRCSTLSAAPVSIVTSPKTGLAELQGAVDLASTAVEDMILAYADGRPLSEVGWGHVDRRTLLELSQLHVLKYALNTETPYAARVAGSNLLEHVTATIDQGASGTKNANTRAPLAARFVAFVGHDTNLEEFAGLLRLHWLLPGYQANDTPPGGALVFEVWHTAGASEAFVRTYFTAQSLDDLRTLSPNQPERVPVFVPGCPALDCPVSAFDRVVLSQIDPAFVGAW